MKKITLILFIVLVGCKDSSKKIKIDKSNFVSDRYNIHKINFIKGSISLPKEYIKLSTNEYRKELLVNTKDTIRRKNIIKGVNQLEKISENLALFIDIENIYNTISIAKSPDYFNFNKTNASQYLNFLKSELSKNGVIFELLEHKYIKLGKSRIIKIKYKSTNGKYHDFRSQYIISSKDKTFFINMVNKYNIDYYKIVKTLKFK